MPRSSRIPAGLLEPLRALYRAVRSRYRQAQLRGPRIVRAFGRAYPTATFVQIGTNDGRKHDPIRASVVREQWTGVMVEPVPDVFSRLVANYGGHPRIKLENVAVAATSGEAPFYYVPQAAPGEQLPSWYDELGSFNKEVVLKHRDRIPRLEERLSCMTVPCVTFDELCRRNGIAAVDLLHTDTEGYDFEIIKTVDLQRTRPLLLIYEHKHFDAATREACRERLRSADYALFEEGADTWCADQRPRDERHRRFLRRWHGLTTAK